MSGGILTQDQRSQIDRVSSELAEWLFRKSEKCVYFSLSHWSGGQQTPVTGKDFPKKTTDRLAHATEMAVEFATAAVRWAETCEGPQRFIVGGHSSNSRTCGAEEQVPFNLSGMEPTREAPSGDMAMVVGHLQRLADRLATQLSVTTQESMDRLKEQNDALLVHAREVEGLYWTSLKQREELLDAKASRDVDTRQKLMSMELKFKAYSQGLAILGKVVGKFMQESPTKEPPTKVTNTAQEQEATSVAEDGKAKLLMSAIASLPPEALASFIGQLPEEEQRSIQPLVPEVMALMPPEKQAAIAEIVMSAGIVPIQGGQ